MNRCLLITVCLIAMALPRGAVGQLLNCTVSATPVMFGVYDSANASPTDSTGTVTVRCTGLLGLLVTLNLQLSTGGSGSFSPRRLVGPSGTLDYNLFRDAARTEVWGNGTAGTFTVSDSFLIVIGGVTRTFTVHGRIPASQDRGPGSYSDTIVVTLNF